MITFVRAFKDNYIWIIIDESNHVAWVVDPGDAKPVLDFLTQRNLELEGVLLTHHHADHSGGIADLKKQWKNLNVVGSIKSSIPEITQKVEEGDEVFCSNYHLKVMSIPGHTLDHIAFYNDEILFCGDTLFSAGCGRVFEGTYEQMFQSLSRLAALPDEVKMYCGHEYTLQNLVFAQRVEPANKAIAAHIALVKNCLMQDEPSLPSRLVQEKKMNPFLRCHHPDVRFATQDYANRKLSTPVEVFQYLREWKNKG